MTQTPDMSEMDDYYARTRKPLFQIPDNRIGKLGCGVLIVLWFVVLTIPCAMIWLAVGNTLTIPHANVPEPEQHPRLQIQLIMEIDNRGLKLTSSSLDQIDETNLCIENNINYLLWKSDANAAPAIYCQCYQRDNSESEWEFTQQIESACNLEE